MTQRIRLATIIPLLLVVSFLTACGFQLRGKLELNSDLTRITVTGTDIPYVRELSEALNNNGITVTDTAEYRLRILSVDREIDEQTQPTAGRYERQLTFATVYQLELSDGLSLFDPVELSNSRYISYDQDQVNAAESEEKITYKELSQELIYTTIRRIAGISQIKLETEVARARKVQQMELEQNSESPQ
ncbi:hypothetical protein ACH42_00790 [Endozoicomonas sp. (ex Bugula neritina AB1)]|nr:hypothetical protein ACH42_00790 [Endozoicomonas sp. (ex Bugula neritina AB1)]